MAKSDTVSANRPNGTEGLIAGPLKQALADALQKSLTSKLGAPVPISPAVLRPLGLLPRHMLLVGDDEPRQKSALDLLARWEIPADVATSGADAVHFASDGQFDLILIDANKSLLDGVFVSSRLRHLERRRNERMPVALVARVSGSWSAAEGVLRTAGVNDVLKVANEGAAIGECLRRWCVGHYRSKSAEGL